MRSATALIALALTCLLASGASCAEDKARVTRVVDFDANDVAETMTPSGKAKETTTNAAVDDANDANDAISDNANGEASEDAGAVKDNISAQGSSESSSSSLDASLEASLSGASSPDGDAGVLSSSETPEMRALLDASSTEAALDTTDAAASGGEKSARKGKATKSQKIKSQRKKSQKKKGRKVKKGKNGERKSRKGSKKTTRKRGGKGKYTPVAPALLKVDRALVPLYRYWNPKLRDHYYTTKRELLGENEHGWRFQGVQCYVYRRKVRGSVPLYHYWNVESGDHFFTTDKKELGPEGKSGYTAEGILAWVPEITVEGSVPLYRYYNAIIGDHFFTDNWSKLGTGKHGWRYEGIAANVFPDPAGTHPQVAGTGKEDGTPLEQRALLVPLYRYWNVHNRDHLYTTRWGEVGTGGHGWVYQGIQALVHARPSPGTVPLHRYYNTATLDHFYTTNIATLGKNGRDGWDYEGVQCYVSPHRSSDTVPLYRYFNARINDHFYTTKWIGKDPNGWKFEGIQAYVNPVGTDRFGTLPNQMSPEAKDALKRVKGADPKLVPLYRYWNREIKDHFYTADWSTLKGGVRGWKYDGIQAYAYSVQRPGTVPLLRFWNAHTGDHFYTVDGAELKDKTGWVAQGTTAYVYKTSDHTGSIPLYRYYNAQTGDHFYTTSWKELERGTNGFEYQGIACYVVKAPRGAQEERRAREAKPVPLYRYYNGDDGDHMYTTTPVKAINGWVYQGIQGFCHREEAEGRVPLYGYYNQRAKDHYYSVQWTGKRDDEWSFTGVICYVPSQKVDGTVPLYRYFSETLHDHYYTTSWNDLKDGRGGFSYQGIATYVYPPLRQIPMTEAPALPKEETPKNVGALYRYYDAAGKDHFYTTMRSVPAAMRREGHAGYVFLRPKDGAVPLYRYFNTASRDHFYTTDWSSLGRAGKNSWKYEGVQCYVYKNAGTAGTIPLYRYYSEADADHLYTVKYLGREKDGFKLQGTTAYVLASAPGSDDPGAATRTTLFRYYNKATRDHFYTTRKEVLGGGIQGWEYQGATAQIYKSPVRGAVPLYVYFNTRINDHYYTTELRQLGKDNKFGWKYEGIEGYVFKRAGHKNTVPLYGYYNAQVHDHFYTTDWSVLRTAGRDGWKYEGVVAYVSPAPRRPKSA